MRPKVLAVVIRDIARAEREGRCNQEYLDLAAVFIAEAMVEPKPEESLKETA